MPLSISVSIILQYFIVSVFQLELPFKLKLHAILWVRYAVAVLQNLLIYMRRRSTAAGTAPNFSGDATENHTQTVIAVLGLRALLLNGQFRPGERMAELPLSERLKVSRTPLRLALTTLEHEGLLELHPSRGYIARAFTLHDIFDAIEIRGVLEGTAARFAVDQLSSGANSAKRSMLEIKEVCQQLQLNVDRPDPGVDGLRNYIDGNKRFHYLLLRMADSDVLTRETEKLFSLPFASPSTCFVLEQALLPKSWDMIRVAQEQHRAIIEAIERFEGGRAEALLREHSRIARRNLELVFRDRSARDLLPGCCLIRDVDQLPGHHPRTQGSQNKTENLIGASR
jgi:GntR family transcriptional regulator of vanillate catabolism